MPYAENDGRGKDRPVLVIGRQDAERVYAVRLTSKAHDGDRDFLAIGSGAWDAQGRPSWVDIEQVYSVHSDGMRREASALDLDRFVARRGRAAQALRLGRRGTDGVSRRGGRYQTRTDDLFRVKEARYQLRQSPVALRGRVSILPDAGCPARTGRARHARAALVWNTAHHRLKSLKRPERSGNADVAQLVAHNLAKVGVASSSLVIRSSAGVFFSGEPRHVGSNHTGGVAERLGTGLQSRLHGFESRRHLHSSQLKSPDGRDWRSGSALP